MDENFQSRYEKNLNSCQTHEELCEYLFKSWPFLERYHKDHEDTKFENDNPFNVKIKKGCQKRDIYLDYLETVEGQSVTRNNQTHVSDSSIQCSYCKKFNTTHTDMRSGDLVCENCGLSETVPVKNSPIVKNKKVLKRLLHILIKGTTILMNGSYNFKPKNKPIYPKKSSQTSETNSKNKKLKILMK